jgi:hypothetical protein
MKSFYEHWEHWWTRKAPPHALALVRIIFGSYLLFYWGLKLPHVAMLYSREGMILPYWDPTAPLMAFLTPLPAPVAFILFGTFLCCLLALTLGMCTRPAALLSCLFSLYYWLLSVHLFGTSFDRLYMFFLFILAWSGCDATFSLHMRWKKGSLFAWEPISILPQRIMAFQISATYFGVGWQKIILPAWQSGTMLSYGFVGRWGSRVAYAIAGLNWPMWVYDIAVESIKLFEVTLPFGLWFRRTRWWFMAGTVIFHVSISILLSIWWFLILIPANILFFEPEEIYGWLKRRSHEKIL